MSRKKRSSEWAFFKKGNAVSDTIFFLVVIFIFAIIAMLAFKFFTEMKPSIYEELPGNESKQLMDDMETRYPSVFDGLVVFLFVLLWAFVIVASFWIDSHPIFFILSFILIVFVVIAAAIMGNFYEELFTDTDLSTLVASFPSTYWIMSHIMYLTIAIAVSILLALYGKSRLS